MTELLSGVGLIVFGFYIISLIRYTFKRKNQTTKGIEVTVQDYVRNRRTGRFIKKPKIVIYISQMRERA